MVLYCPYCENEINQTQLEQEDGCCPECGAPVSATTVINEEDEYDDEYGDEFGDDDLDDDLDDAPDESDPFYCPGRS